MKANEVTRADIEQFKQALVLGKTARDEKLGPQRRSIVRGGKGALTRTLGLLGAVFAWAGNNGYVEHNPVRGVRRFADTQKKALLSGEQYRALAETLDALDARRDRNGERMHSAMGISATRTSGSIGSSPWTTVSSNVSSRFGQPVSNRSGRNRWRTRSPSLWSTA